MFEAKLGQALVLKKLVEAIKDLVEMANIDCAADGIKLQAMDSSHVALVSFFLKSEGFADYRCDRNVSLGVNLVNLSKILKCAGNDDSITLRAEDEGDTLHFIFESEKGDRISEFDMKLMDIDQEHLGIPDTEYKCTVKMGSSEYTRIMRDLSVLGDTATIAVNKDGVKFTVSGDMGTGSVLKKPSEGSKDDEGTSIEMEEPTDLAFALRYLMFFTKAAPLATQVALHMSREVPLMVEFKAEKLGHLRFYLAPKIDEESSS